MFKQLLLCVFMTAILASCVLADDGRPVARVNGKPITEAQLQQTLMDWYGREALEEMIQTWIIEDAATRAEVTVTEEEVDERVREMQEAMDARAEAGQGQPFDIWLASRRMSFANYRSRVRTELLLEKLVLRQVRVTSEEVSAYYEKNRSMFREPARVQISVISCRTEQEAAQLKSSIADGTLTWEQAAVDHNVNPYTMKTGGVLGYITTDDTSPLRRVAFELEHDGDISAPLDFGGLFSLVRREERHPQRTLPFEDVKGVIEEVLREEKMMRLAQETRTALLKAAHIERLVEFPPRPGEGQ